MSNIITDTSNQHHDHREALNLVRQIHPQFKKITAQLNKLLGIEFGYMKVFKDGGYFKIMDDLECMERWVTNVDQSHIFCERNITNCFDGDYNFTLWPKEPSGTAMEIYHKYNIWNGITVSKINHNYTEVYWFTGGTTRTDWHKFFIRNKQLLLRFIKYFESFKGKLHIPGSNSQQILFKFNQGFDIELHKSEYIKEESPSINRLINLLDVDPALVNNLQTKVSLTCREIEVLSIICHGHTVKVAAQQLGISARTVQEYIIRIKQKTGFHFKTELIEFYNKESRKN